MKEHIQALLHRKSNDGNDRAADAAIDCAINLMRREQALREIPPGDELAALVAMLVREEINLNRRPVVKALRAAIDLMNAAKPLDEAAEKEECWRIAHSRVEGGFTALCTAWTSREVADLLSARGAQARAEGYAKSEQERAAIAERCERQDHALKLMSQLGTETERQLRAQLSAAQAEIERLQTGPVPTTANFDADAVHALLALLPRTLGPHCRAWNVGPATVVVIKLREASDEK